jgi:uncharacterized iron-regulated membrane protein
MPGPCGWALWPVSERKRVAAVIRKIVFWCHLTAGVTAGIVILAMCVTGVLLMYERQVLAWAEKSLRSRPPNGTASRRSPEALLLKLYAAQHVIPATLTLHSDLTAAAEASVVGRTFYLDVYSGQSAGEGAKAVRSFFRTVTDVHRWLAMQGSNRSFGRAITGAANLVFLFIVLSGMYLWLPRKCSWRSVRAVVLFGGGQK